MLKPLSEISKKILVEKTIQQLTDALHNGDFLYAIIALTDAIKVLSKGEV